CCGIGHIGPACRTSLVLTSRTRRRFVAQDVQPSGTRGSPAPPRPSPVRYRNVPIAWTTTHRSRARSLTAFAKRQWGRTDFGCATSSLWSLAPPRVSSLVTSTTAYVEMRRQRFYVN
ncbi:hypothetical protein FOZ63_012411, partial [Perkinsus olseni]